MMKWKIDKKYIYLAGLVLGIILISLVFNNLLEQSTKYAGIKNTIASTMFPIMAGFILAYLLNPILKFLERCLFMPLAGKLYTKKDFVKKQKRFSRALGVTFTIALFILFVVGGVYLVAPQIYVSILKIVEDVPTYFKEIEGLIMSYLEDENEVTRYVIGVLDSAYLQLMEFANTVVIPNMDKIVKGITTGIIGGVKTALNIVLSVIISIYVLFEKENLISYSKKITYSYLNVKHANTFVTGVRYVNKVFGGFINGKIVDSFIIGVLCYIFMAIVGFEYTVLISIIVGITNVIPYFGPFIGAIPSIFILLMTDPKQGLIFAVFILILQQLDGNVIGPLILGESLKISSMWILIAILIGGGLFGVAGMILGAPTLACIYALLGNDTKKRLAKRNLPTESKDYLMLDTVKEDMEVVFFDEEQLNKKDNKKDTKKAD